MLPLPRGPYPVFFRGRLERLLPLLRLRREWRRYHVHDAGVCVCVFVCVFWISIVRANRLTNEKTSACSRENSQTHS